MTDRQDNLVRFDCPNGHRLKADSRHQGRTARCPSCGSHTVVPKMNASMTPSAVLQILEDAKTSPNIAKQRILDKSLQRREELGELRVECPRCQELVSPKARACNNCNLYMGGSDQSMFRRTLRRVFRAG